MLKIRDQEEKYILSTVRLVTDTGTGTGFICQLKNKDFMRLTSVYFLVTNKHVIKDAKQLTIKMHKLDSANGNKLTKEIEVDLNDQEEITISEDINSLFYFHPNDKIDIAILNMNQYVLKEFIPLLMPIEIDDIIPNRYSTDINIYDDVTFIGYPNGLYDHANLLPIIRKGSFATPYQVDFNNESTFLIDASVFPGSSGSPVFLFDRLKEMHNGTKINITKPRIFFLGIVASVYTQDDIFDLIEAKSIKTKGRHMLDIGVVFKATEIRKLIKAYFAEKVLQIPIDHDVVEQEEELDKILIEVMREVAK